MKKQRISVHHLLPGLSLVFTLFVFAPIDLYMSIREELWFPLSMLGRWLLIFAAAAFVFVTALACLLPKKWSVAFRSAVYACSFLAWLQGNVLLLDYGTLDGRQIDWSAYTVPYILDMLLWIAVIGLFVFLMFRFRKKFRRILEIAACILLITQILSLAFLLFRDQGLKEGAEVRYLSRNGLYTVSPENNTVVFILDSFDTELFEQLYQEDPERIGREFNNFTFYPDTVGGATRTKYAIPFILTGEINRKPQSYQDFLKESFGNSPLIRELASGRYDTGIYSVNSFIDLNREDAIGNISTGIPLSYSRRGLTAEYMKLVAFRCAPSLFSRFFWIYSGDFERYKSDIGESYYGLDDAGYFRNLISQRLSASAEKACFRFIHLNGAHEPYTLDANARSGQSDEAGQGLGSLHIVSEYLEQMQALGVYENAAVFVMADHGFREHKPNEQTPLFMVKFAGLSHPFEVSDLPLSYVSMPEIMTSALQGTLTSLEPYRADGTRYFYVQNQRGDLSVITEMTVDGPAMTSPVVHTGVIYYEDTKLPDREQ